MGNWQGKPTPVSQETLSQGKLRVREEVAARTMIQRGDPTLACTDEVVLRWREVERRWELQCQ